MTCERCKELEAACAAMRRSLEFIRPSIDERYFNTKNVVAQSCLLAIDKALDYDAGRSMLEVVEAAKELMAQWTGDGFDGWWTEKAYTLREKLEALR